MKTITNMKNIIKKSQENSISYDQYKQLVIDLFQQGQSTTKNGSGALVDYTKLNISRMKRLDKTTVLPEEVIERVKSIDKKIEWLVLSEGWCGDAAQNLPIINAVAKLNDKIDLKIVLRDQNSELMDQFLTNGGQAIPKLIQLENDNVTATWGPRPTIAANMVRDYKAKHGSLSSEFKKDLQVWYNQDKAQNLLEDLMEILN